MEWVYFPKTEPIPDALRDAVFAFHKHHSEIDSRLNDTNEERLKSDDVLAIVAPSLESLGFAVERGKKEVDKIRIPVLYGVQGREELWFEADAYCATSKTVVEVEAGRAVVNYQFLKDIFEASMMVDTDYLILAVRSCYQGRNDFEKIMKYLETIYLTNKLGLDLKGIVLIGY